MGDPINRVHGHAGQPADGLVESPAPTRVDLAADFRVLCPVERRALGHPILSRPLGDRFALRDRQGEIDFLMAADFFFHGALHLISDSEGVSIRRPEAEFDIAVFGHPCNGVPWPPGRTSLRSYLMLLQRHAEPGLPAGRRAERPQKLQKMAVFQQNSSVCTLCCPGGSWVGARETLSVVSLPPSSFGLHPSSERQSRRARMKPAVCGTFRYPDPSRSGGRGPPVPSARSRCAMMAALERGLWPVSADVSAHGRLTINFSSSKN